MLGADGFTRRTVIGEPSDSKRKSYLLPLLSVAEHTTLVTWPVAKLPSCTHLPADFKARLASVLSSLDLHQLPEADQKFLASNENPQLMTVPQSDAAYNQIRDLVSTLHIDLAKL